MLSARKLLLLLIRCYQLGVSPMLRPSCRFYPSCSCYAHTAIERFGVLRGLGLSAHRIARCHPFCQGGYDPVPDEKLIHG
jgi:putative membrane protein insertion efficiency factor